MAKRSRKRLLRSPAVLVVALVTVLGLSGLAYALWVTTLTSEGNVHTGGVAVAWYDMGTDDDGDVENDGSGTDDDVGEVFDMNPGRSSADPASHGPGAVVRYDKDVAQCNAGGGGDRLNTWIDNAYPSYNCTVYAKVRNEGSVPIKAAGLTMTAVKVTCGDPFQFWLDEARSSEYIGVVGWDQGGPFTDNAPENGERDDGELQLWESCTENEEPMFLIFGGVEQPFAIAPALNSLLEDWELTADIAQGIRCGTQLDPWLDQGGEFFETVGWVHVEEAATQNTGYRWTLVQRFVNWNEFSYLQCNEGVVAADANGTRIGIVDHDEPDGVLLDL